MREQNETYKPTSGARTADSSTKWPSELSAASNVSSPRSQQPATAASPGPVATSPQPQPLRSVIYVLCRAKLQRILTFRHDIPVLFYKLNTKYISSSRNTTKLLYCVVQYVTQLHVSAPFLDHFHTPADTARNRRELTCAHRVEHFYRRNLTHQPLSRHRKDCAA